jgi:hypothetical protein
MSIPTICESSSQFNTTSISDARKLRTISVISQVLKYVLYSAQTKPLSILGTQAVVTIDMYQFDTTTPCDWLIYSIIISYF